MGIFSVFKETDAKGAQDLSRAKKIDERRHLCEKFLVFTTGTTHLSRALLCVLVGAQAWGAPADKSQLLKKFDYDNLHADTYMVNRPGKWESDLWYFREAGKPDQPFERPAPGRRPPPNGDCEFRLSKGGVVSLSSAVRIMRLKIYNTNTTLLIAKGGELGILHNYLGQRDIGSGGIEVREGGKLLMDGGHFSLGGVDMKAVGTGSLSQKGGLVSLSCQLSLTGNLPATSSRQATGVYTLSNGTLIIEAPDGEAGIVKGMGKGSFVFEKGTLQANTLAIDLDNTGGGNLSPAGDEAVGQTTLVRDKVAEAFAKAQGKPYDDARSYTQGKNSVFTVNVEGAKKYDRLIWKTPGKKGSVLLKDGAVIRLRPLKNFKLSTGVRYAFDVIEADDLKIQGDLTIDAGALGRDFTYEVLDGKILRLKTKR